jgi:hypothetical protein
MFKFGHWLYRSTHCSIVDPQLNKNEKDCRNMLGQAHSKAGPLTGSPDVQTSDQWLMLSSRPIIIGHGLTVRYGAIPRDRYPHTDPSDWH